jgi:hypothetical protein
MRGSGIVFRYGFAFQDPSKELATKRRNCGTFLNWEITTDRKMLYDDFTYRLR